MPRVDPRVNFMTESKAREVSEVSGLSFGVRRSRRSNYAFEKNQAYCSCVSSLWSKSERVELKAANIHLVIDLNQH
jgi:hypothetical protein